MPSPTELLKSIARIAVTAAIHPAAVDLTAAREGVGWGIEGLKSLLGRAEEKRKVSKLADDIAESLQKFIASEKLSANAESILTTTEQALERTPLSAEMLHDLHLDPARAAQEVWDRAGNLKTGLSDAEGSLVRRTLHLTYESLLADPDTLFQLEDTFRKVVLEKLANLGNELQAALVDHLENAMSAGLLRSGHRLWERGKAPPSALLGADYEVVPFEGRQEELDDLATWCGSDPEGKSSVAVRLYTAPGGMGKSRLMLQACRQQRWSRWTTGFVNLPESQPNLHRGLEILFKRARRPLLLVIDYAERRTDQLVTICTALQDTPVGVSVRIVLLARGASTRGGWWQEVRSRSDILLAAPLDPIPLEPLFLGTEDRQALFSKAAKALASKARQWEVLDDKELARLEESPSVPDLSGDLYQRILFLHLRAFAAIQGSSPESEEELLDFVLSRESRYWQRRAKQMNLNLSSSTLEDVAVLLTLAGPVKTENELRSILRRVPALEGQSADVLGRVETLFRDLYPSTSEIQSHAIQPDLLGERLVERATKPSSTLLRVALGPEAEVEQKVSALTVLARVAQRREEAAPSPEDLRDLQEWLLRALRIDPTGLAGPAIRVVGESASGGRSFPGALHQVLSEVSPLEALKIANLFPLKSVELREIACLVNRTALEGLPESDGGPHDEVLPTRAGLLNNLANHLADIGDREDALKRCQEGVDLYRELAEKRPDEFNPDLAMSLNNLANHLANLGHREDALKRCQEAVEIRRELAEKRPDAFNPKLAMSLNNLANHLADIGDREDALKRCQEGVDLYRELAEKRPDEFNPDLAMSLNNLSVRLANLGHREDALKACQEAVDLYRELAEKRPDAFNPDLARSLNNLSNHLANLGHREDALKACQEAVDLYQELAEKRPDAFNPDLAKSLNNLAVRLAELGKREAALKACQEAVDLYRELVEKRPDAFNPDLANSLSNLSNRLADLGDRESALKRCQEAVDLYRKLAEKRPDAFNPELASSLNNLSNRLAEIGNHKGALKRCQEAVDLYRELAEKRPDAFNPDLASSLNNLSNRLADLGDHKDALIACQEAVEIRRELAEKRPDAFNPDLAGSLNNLSNHLADLGDHEGALNASVEAVERLAPYFVAHPAAFEGWMRIMLGVYAQHVEVLGRPPDLELLEPILATMKLLDSSGHPEKSVRSPEQDGNGDD